MHDRNMLGLAGKIESGVDIWRKVNGGPRCHRSLETIMGVVAGTSIGGRARGQVHLIVR